MATFLVSKTIFGHSWTSHIATVRALLVSCRQRNIKKRYVFRNPAIQQHNIKHHKTIKKKRSSLLGYFTGCPVMKSWNWDALLYWDNSTTWIWDHPSKREDSMRFLMVSRRGFTGSDFWKILIDPAFKQYKTNIHESYEHILHSYLWKWICNNMNIQ